MSIHRLKGDKKLGKPLDGNLKVISSVGKWDGAFNFLIAKAENQKDENNRSLCVAYKIIKVTED